MANSDSTTRFSNRVEDYAKYRPGYPAGVLDVLAAHAGLSAGAVIADVGAGTGISTRLLLESGARVIAVEPNGPMRQAMVAGLGNHPRLVVSDGTAEATGIGAASVDLVTCFQAFHWFDPAKTRAEFTHILRPGSVALVWNDRLADGSSFMVDYDRLLKKLPAGNRADGHDQVAIDGRIAAFFHPQPVRCDVLTNSQRLEFPSLAGRLRSSSYTPTPDQPEYGPMMSELREIFDRHQQAGFVGGEAQVPGNPGLAETRREARSAAGAFRAPLRVAANPGLPESSATPFVEMQYRTEIYTGRLS